MSGTTTASSADSVRPFTIETSQADLDDLRARIEATRWPDKEPVGDNSQGLPLATMQKLARYWATDYDWRKVEARLNALPQFITEIDGLDIHLGAAPLESHAAVGMTAESYREAWMRCRSWLRW